jgi:two-component system LytT family sensor kinase
VARWVSGQLELAELDESRSRLAEAQVRALRAQISPHFIFNALTAIASFVRTDPDRARDLLLDFADFTRYASRTHGEFTTLAEELRSIDRYLLLERARFGDRLQVVLRVAPEVLPVAVPYLCLQPLVENAVQHGLERGGGSGTVTVVAEDDGAQCRITVEDDGAGSDPSGCGRCWPARGADAAGHRRSGWATSTRGCARCTATTTGWSSRPPSARAPR